MTAATTDQQPPRMDCQRVMRDELGEKYVSGRLDEADREAYEFHYFECARCSNELEALILLRTELERSVPRSGDAAARVGSRRALWLSLAAAAVIVAAVAVLRWPSVPEATTTVSEGASGQAQPLAQAESQPAAIDPVALLARLAEVSPPVYRPATLRSAPSSAVQRFREAMESYARGDYAGAMPGLGQATALDATLPQAWFFLGACHLMTEDADSAIEAWRTVVGLGESAYLEEARFYLAKALLRKGDVAAARAELEATVALAGDREAEARDLLRQLQNVR